MIFWLWFIYKSFGFYLLKFINILLDIYVMLVWVFLIELYSLFLVNVLMFVWYLLNKLGKFIIIVWIDGRECICMCVWYIRLRLYSLNVIIWYVIWFLSVINDNIVFILKVEECNLFVFISELCFYIIII